MKVPTREEDDDECNAMRNIWLMDGLEQYIDRVVRSWWMATLGTESFFGAGPRPVLEQLW